MQEKLCHAVTWQGTLHVPCSHVTRHTWCAAAQHVQIVLYHESYNSINCSALQHTFVLWALQHMYFDTFQITSLHNIIRTVCAVKLPYSWTMTWKTVLCRETYFRNFYIFLYIAAKRCHTQLVLCYTKYCNPVLYIIGLCHSAQSCAIQLSLVPCSSVMCHA